MHSGLAITSHPCPALLITVLLLRQLQPLPSGAGPKILRKPRFTHDLSDNIYRQQCTIAVERWSHYTFAVVKSCLTSRSTLTHLNYVLGCPRSCPPTTCCQWPRTKSTALLCASLLVLSALASPHVSGNCVHPWFTPRYF